MLDMGFLPDIRRVLRHIPTRRQTLFFSATMPAPIARSRREMLKNPVPINLQRQAAPAVGITQAVYPVPQELKAPLFVELLERGILKEALVFTRTKHRANRLADYLVQASRQRGAHPRQPLAGAADRGARRVQERQVPRARRHRHRRARHRRRGARPRRQLRRARRCRRTTSTASAAPARAERPATRSRSWRRRRKATCARSSAPIGKSLPRVTLPDFDYRAKPQSQLEVPRAQRIAEIRARKADERARAKAKAERHGGAGSGGHGPRRDEPRWGKKSSAAPRTSPGRRTSRGRS